MYSVTGNFSGSWEYIDEEPLVQVSVATKKSTEDPLPSIYAIWPITGKYFINYI